MPDCRQRHSARGARSAAHSVSLCSSPAISAARGVGLKDSILTAYLDSACAPGELISQKYKRQGVIALLP